MLAMIQSDFITMKNSLLQLVGICAIIAIFMWIGTGELISGVGAVAAMLPFMYIFSIAAYDEMNGWERFRLTLPISRRQVVVGRYASILIVVVASAIFMLLFTSLVFAIVSFVPLIPVIPGLMANYNPATALSYALIVSTVILFAATITMPLFMRFGMTKGTRIAPLLIVLILVVGLYALGEWGEPLLASIPGLEMLLVPTAESIWLSLGLSVAIFAIFLVPYLVSILISVKLYEQRQF